MSHTSTTFQVDHAKSPWYSFSRRLGPYGGCPQVHLVVTPGIMCEIVPKRLFLLFQASLDNGNKHFRAYIHLWHSWWLFRIDKGVPVHIIPIIWVTVIGSVYSCCVGFHMVLEQCVALSHFHIGEVGDSICLHAKEQGAVNEYHW